MKGYNPFMYQPQMRSFYNGAPLPQNIAKAAEKSPEAAQHLQSVHAFNEWLKDRFPAAHGALATRAPQTLDVVKTVIDGGISPGGRVTARGLAGMGDFAPSSDWGKTISDTVSAVIQGKAQNDLIRLNIDRAEKGLPPIDSAAVTPGVNFGLSSDVQKIAVIGIGIAAVLGLASIIRRR